MMGASASNRIGSRTAGAEADEASPKIASFTTVLVILVVHIFPSLEDSMARPCFEASLVTALVSNEISAYLAV